MEFRTLRFRVLFEHHDLDETILYIFKRCVWFFEYICVFYTYEKASKKKPNERHNHNNNNIENNIV